VLQNLAGCYRDLTIAKTAPKRPDLVALTSETWTELVKIAQTWQLSWILAGQKHLKDSEVQLKHSTQPQLWLEIAILGLLTVSTQPPAVATITAPSPISVTPQIAPPPPSQPDRVAISTPAPVAPTAPKVAIDPQNISNTWEQVLQQLLPASRDLFKPFGKLISISETQAIVAMKSDTMQSIASGKVPELAKVFSQIFGRSIAVKLDVMGRSQIQPISSIVAPLPASPPVAPPPPPVVPMAIPAVGEYLTDEEEVADPSEDIQAVIEPIINLPPSPDPTPQPPIPTEPAPLEELDEPPTDFAEPPESMDIDRAANMSEPEELEIDSALQIATDNIIKIFSGEIIDRTHELFDKIVGI
jgi:DNA polymerase III subunit gamma/tau